MSFASLNTFLKCRRRKLIDWENLHKVTDLYWEDQKYKLVSGCLKGVAWLFCGEW